MPFDGRARGSLNISQRKNTPLRQWSKKNPLEILGIRPGITLDSIRKIMTAVGVTLREVREDTLSHSYAAQDGCMSMSSIPSFAG